MNCDCRNKKNDEILITKINPTSVGFFVSGSLCLLLCFAPCASHPQKSLLRCFEIETEMRLMAGNGR